MYIKTYECDLFAGIRDVKLQFEEGLNVILGPNEAGKSTIVDGIYSTLFKNIKLSQRENADKEFSFRYFPKPTGDFINGKITFENNEGIYQLTKEWGTSERIELRLPDGAVLRNESEINEKLREILIFGESTYENIVFAKQRELKGLLGRITDKKTEAAREIKDILRMSLMELGGVSVDGIQKKIETELEEIYKRWDRDKSFPEGNRGINNPYKNGLGEILKSFYEKETLKVKMDEADRAEKEFESISNRKKICEERLEKIKNEKTDLEQYEDGVNNNKILDLKIGIEKSAIEELINVNEKWPLEKKIVEDLEKESEEIAKEKQALEEENKNAELYNKLEMQIKRRDSVLDTEEEIKKLREKLAESPKITNEDVDFLLGLERQILGHEAKMKAGRIIGKITSSTGKEIRIAKDLGDFEDLGEKSEFDAKSYVKISYGNELELEIKAADMDFEEIRKKHNTCKRDLSEKLDMLNVKDISSAKVALGKVESTNGELKQLSEKLKMILGNTTIEKIEEEIAAASSLGTIRSREEIEKKLEKLRESEKEIGIDISKKRDILEEWDEKYIDTRSLLDMIWGKKKNLEQLQDEQAKITPLPEGFRSGDEFKEHLQNIKKQYDDYNSALLKLSQEFSDAGNLLPEESYEDYKEQYKQAEQDYEKNIKKGEKLLEIQRVFHEVKEKMGKDPMEKLVEEFLRVLSIITNSRYNKGKISEDFDVQIENAGNKVPMGLLSAGTYDAVTLALRFALVKHLFGENKGYIVLDDCLVDLDPERKQLAISVIKDFSKDHQLIFTTCDPETAKMLGGNIINYATG